MKKPLNYFILSTLAILTGCGIFPHINCNKVPDLRVGMTETELVKLMGEPYFQSLSIKSGTIEAKILGWQNKESPVESSDLLRVNIDSQGKVIDYSGKCTGQPVHPH